MINLNFDQVRDMPALLLNAIEPITVNGPDDSSAIAFANDAGSYLAVSETSRDIVSISKESGQFLRYVNTSLQKFIAFQIIYFSEIDDLQSEDDEVAIGAVDRVRRKMLDEDEKACRDPENWWLVILEQIEEGNL